MPPPTIQYLPAMAGLTRRAVGFAVLVAAGGLAGCSSLRGGPIGGGRFVSRPPPPMTPEALQRATNLALGAMSFLDVPYTWGGNTPEEGFDCSGFTRHVYQRVAGIPLPRLAESQARVPGFYDVPLSELAPGDLVFFNTLRRPYSHVGIYVGDWKFVHAPRTGAQVRTESLRASYWESRYDGARRAA